MNLKNLIPHLIISTFLTSVGASEPPTDINERDLFMILLGSQLNDQNRDIRYPLDDEDEYDDYSDETPPPEHNYNTRSKKRKATDQLIDEAPLLKKKAIELTGIPYPLDIYNELIQYTMGQDDAMRSLSIFIHTHMINTRINQDSPNLETPYARPLEKSNIVMLGPTGCGKTSTLEVLAKYLGTPLVVGNATEWTSQGYVGRKWQDIFETLWTTAKSHLDRDGKTHGKAEYLECAQRSIVFIDEIDKLCPGLDGKDLDVINRVQQELLPVIQGTKVKLKSGIELDTSDMLFIGGGAFAGLTTDSKKSKKITTHDLHRYGMLPELAGRLSNIVQFAPLEQKHLVDIIKKSKHSFIGQSIYKFKVAYGIDLTFDDGAIDYIAEMASKQLTGARAINTMINKLMEDILFTIQDHHGKPLTITKEIAKKTLKGFIPPPDERSSPPLGMYS